MTQWIAVTWQHVDCDGTVAMIVEADGEQRAAQIAADYFTEHDNFRDALPITHVFVAPWDRRAYEIGCKAQLAELQCCGGGERAEWVGLGGHWATCPEAPKGADDDDA